MSINALSNAPQPGASHTGDMTVIVTNTPAAAPVTETQQKLNTLMTIIHGGAPSAVGANTDGTDNKPLTAAAMAFMTGASPPLPSFEELVGEVEAQQLSSPQPLPRIVASDVMDCFRLYFGSSVTTFPFYAARLGAVGFVVVISGAGYLGLMTQMALHRARYNLVLLELQRRMAKDANGGHVAIEMGNVTPTGSRSASTSVSAGVSPTTPGDAAGGGATPKKSRRKVKPPPDPSDMIPVFFKVDTLVKVCNALWPDHWMRQVFSAITFIAQFFACCSYTLLFASNVGPVLGLGDSKGVYLGAALMAVLTMATQPKAKTFLAYVNNIFIFGGACIILFASFIHEPTEEEKAMKLQIFPKSVSELAMYAPSVLTYVSAQLLTIDAESIVGMRAHRVMQGKTPEPSAESLAASPATSMTTTPVTQTAPNGGAFPTPTKLSPAATPAGLFSAAFGGLRAETLKQSLINVQTVQGAYKRAVEYGLFLSIVVLIFFAELIMMNFKDNTNAIIALSFPVSATRTAILIALSIGLYACGALNISPICDMIDVFCQELEAMEFMPILKQATSRAILFICVVAFLWLVPFFDMVAGLSGAVCTPMFAFFIPSACELQSEMLRAAASKELRDVMAAASPMQRMTIGWGRMPLRGRITMAIAMVLGSIILVFSTSSVVAEIIRRRTAME